MTYCKARGGAPHLARLLRSGETARIVAFGSSMTDDGIYLAHVKTVLEAAYPGTVANIDVLGYRGIDSVFGAFYACEAAARQPDAVLIEFAINDQAEAGATFIAAALAGMIETIRRSAPACDFVFVYNGRVREPGYAEAFAIPVHDAVADALGVPSIDLYAYSRGLLDRGEADAVGTTERSLTLDGTHHAPAAATLVGIPFAEALAAVVAATPEAAESLALPSFAAMRDAASPIIPQSALIDGEALCAILLQRFHLPNSDLINGVVVSLGGSQRVEADMTPFARAFRADPRRFVRTGAWSPAQLDELPALHHGRDMILARSADAMLRIPFGPFVCVMGYAEGAIGIAIDGQRTELMPPAVGGTNGRVAWLLVLTNGMSDEPHVLELTPRGPSLVCDVFIIEPTAAG